MFLSGGNCLWCCSTTHQPLKLEKMDISMLVVCSPNDIISKVHYTFGKPHLAKPDPFLIKFSPYPLALQVLLSAGRDCLIAGDTCSSDETCSPRLRTLRQCVAGNGSMKLGPGARSQCANAVSALLSSPLHGCQCRRGMKREKNCLSIYWSLHQSGMHGE